MLKFQLPKLRQNPNRSRNPIPSGLLLGTLIIGLGIGAYALTSSKKAPKKKSDSLPPTPTPTPMPPEPKPTTKPPRAPGPISGDHRRMLQDIGYSIRQGSGLSTNNADQDVIGHFQSDWNAVVGRIGGGSLSGKLTVDRRPGDQTNNAIEVARALQGQGAVGPYTDWQSAVRG